MKKNIVNKILIFMLVFSICLLICSNVSADDNYCQDNNYENVTNEHFVNDSSLLLSAIDDNATDYTVNKNLKKVSVSNIDELNNVISSYDNVVINLMEGDYNITKLGHSILVSQGKNITINGNLHVIDGNGANMRFMVIEKGAAVVLNNLNIENFLIQSYASTSKTDLRGGAIYNSGDLIIHGVYFVNNRVDSGDYGYGGAIYNNEGYLYIDNSAFRENYVFTYTVYDKNWAYGGAICNYNGNAIISSCTFTDNNINKNHKKGQSAYGGAIYNLAKSHTMDNRTGNLIVINSHFVDNTAQSILSGQYAMALGGAICNDGFLSIISSTFIGNVASVSSGGAGLNALGGAIYSCIGSVTTITGSCKFSYNKAEASKQPTGMVMQASNGGAIACYGNLYINCFSLTMVGNTARCANSIYLAENQNNAALRKMYSPEAEMEEQDSYSEHVGLNYIPTFNFNGFVMSNINYDIKYNDGSNITIYSDIKSIDEIGLIIKKNYADHYVFNLLNDVVLVDTLNFGVGQQVTINGNGYSIDGNNKRFMNVEGAYILLVNLTLKNCQVKEHSSNIFNSITIKGGSIINNGELYIINCTFDHNGISSEEFGYGGVISNTGFLNMFNSTFVNNYVVTYTYGDADNNARGGVIYNSGGANVINCTFSNNNINKGVNKGQYGGGGAIYNIGNMTILGSKFNDNIVEGQVQAHSIRGWGGAICNDNELYISDCEFINNKVNVNSNTGSDDSYGGAIHTATNAITKIEGYCSFIGNEAGDYGGAIHNDGQTIINCANVGIKFIDNKANGKSNNFYSSNNYVIFNGVSFDSLSGNIDFKIVNNVTVVNVTSFNEIVYYINEYDNVIINLYGDEYFVSNTIDVNLQKKVVINGNGVIIDGNNHRFMNIIGTIYLNNLTLINCKLSQHANTGIITINGGAIVNSGRLFITNCTFTNNGLDSDEHANGGVIYNKGILNMFNSTFYNNYAHTRTYGENDNYAYGGVIYNVKSGSVKIISCNFTNNDVNKGVNKGQYGYGGAIYNDGNMTVWESVFDGNEIQGEVQSNWLNGYGGAICNDNNLNIYNCNFTNNKVNVYSATGKDNSYGGAIYTGKNALSIIDGNCYFVGNSAEDYGGAICSDGKTIVDYNTIVMKSNSASNGKNLYASSDGKILLNGVNYYTLNDDIDENSSGISKFWIIIGNVTVYIRVVDCVFFNGTTFNGVELMNNLIINSGYNFTGTNAFSFNEFIMGVALKYNLTNDDFSNLTNIFKEMFEKVYGDNIKSFTFLAYSIGSAYLNHYCYINSSEELINFAKSYNSNPYKWDNLNLYLTNSEYIIESSLFTFDKSFSNVHIIGNNSLVKIKKPGDREDYHFISDICENQVISVENLIFSGFNSVIINHGNLYVINCTFDRNRMNYVADRDYGGAIRNFGTLVCINSVFTNNYAKYGGAIYNKDAVCILYNCTFKDNDAYGSGGGDDVYVYNTDLRAELVSCSIENFKPFDTGWKMLIGFVTGMMVTAICMVLPPVGGALTTFLVCTVVGGVAGAAFGILTGLLYGIMDQKDIGKSIGEHALKGFIEGLIIGAIVGVGQAIDVIRKGTRQIEELKIEDLEEHSLVDSSESGSGSEIGDPQVQPGPQQGPVQPGQNPNPINPNQDVDLPKLDVEDFPELVKPNPDMPETNPDIPSNPGMPKPNVPGPKPNPDVPNVPGPKPNPDVPNVHPEYPNPDVPNVHPEYPNPDNPIEPSNPGSMGGNEPSIRPLNPESNPGQLNPMPSKVIQPLNRNQFVPKINTNIKDPRLNVPRIPDKLGAKKQSSFWDLFGFGCNCNG